MKEESDKTFGDLLKDVMRQNGLTLTDIRIVKYEHPENKEVVVDLKNRVIRMQRELKVENMRPSLVITALEQPIEDELFKKLVEIDKPKFDWKKGSGDSWYVPYNSMYNIVEIEYKEGRAFSDWKIDVIGVMSENISGFDLKDVDAVKKLAETKVFEAVGKINDIIKRSK